MRTKVVMHPESTSDCGRLGHKHANPLLSAVTEKDAVIGYSST